MLLTETVSNQEWAEDGAERRGQVDELGFIEIRVPVVVGSRRASSNPLTYGCALRSLP